MTRQMCRLREGRITVSGESRKAGGRHSGVTKGLLSGAERHRSVEAGNSINRLRTLGATCGYEKPALVSRSRTGRETWGDSQACTPPILSRLRTFRARAVRPKLSRFVVMDSTQCRVVSALTQSDGLSQAMRQRSAFVIGRPAGKTSGPFGY